MLLLHLYPPPVFLQTSVPRKPAFLPGKHLRRAALHNVPMLHDVHDLRIQNPGQAMADGQDGSFHAGHADGIQHLPFRQRIQSRRQFIQQQYGRIRHDGSGQRQQLVLPMRQFRFPFAEHCIQRLRKGMDGIAQPDLSKRPFHLLPGDGAVSEGDVSNTLPWKTSTVCGTMPIRRRRSSGRIRYGSMPPIRTTPSLVGYNPATSCSRVVLPEPVLPAIAAFVPGGMSTDTPDSTACPST